MSREGETIPISLGKESLTSVSHLRNFAPTVVSCVGRMDVNQKPKCICFKPRLPCNICKGYHLTHFFPSIPEVQSILSKSEGSSTPEFFMVSQLSHQCFIDELVKPMQSLVDYTPLFVG